VKNIHFKDSIVIEQPVSSTLRTDAATMLDRDKQTRLKVQIDATHSGVIINNRVYPGKFVKDGHRSFFSKDNGGLSQYDKPILKHHSMHEDPIGRIVDAQFTQLKHGSSFDNDFLTPDENGTKGSGVVTITGIITDSEAIAKILDSRYLSVSAGHSSPYMLCSNCADSIFSCDHYPGLRYNEEGEQDDGGELCYAITGPLRYNETSFVNLPASPAAKLTNFEWTDSKDSWNKAEHIASQISGRKETVRCFTLCDEDGELSLLSGKSNPTKKKTVVVVSPATADKLKHVISSEDTSVEDEPVDGRLPSVGKASGAPDVERNLDKANDLDKTSKKDTEMEKELEDAKTEIQNLKDQLTTAQTKTTDTEKLVEAKDSQIERLTTDAQGMQDKMSSTLAMSLVSMRTRFGKQLPKGDDGEELTADQYVAKLSDRSVESLQDSLADLMFEIDQLPVDKTVTNTPSASTVLGKDQVTDPTPTKEGNAPKEKKSSTPKRAIDNLSDGLGI
tara:strand:+ start:58141 stop:59649 length:1509 start_codon:yes stop_codon:yes gene_type:complete